MSRESGVVAGKLNVVAAVKLQILVTQRVLREVPKHSEALG